MEKVEVTLYLNMKKLLFVLLCMVLLAMPLVSSANWDNKLSYLRGENGNPDLKVTLSNSFLLLFKTSDIGTAELKSHPSVNYVKKVGAGNQVVMWYDFNFLGLYENGLGEVEFTDMRTGELLDRDYSFVYWGEKERDVYGQGNCFLSVNGTKTCEQIVVGKETYETWLPYNSKDIPKGKIRIGLMTYVEVGDKVDGVWTIAGKKVSKHAGWTEDLNVDLISYWKFDEEDTSGTGTIYDELGTNNGTNAGASNTTGKIVYAYNFTNDYIELPFATITLPYTITLWAWLDNVNENMAAFADHDATTNDFLLYVGKATALYQEKSGQPNMNLAGPSMPAGQWIFVAITYSGTVGKMYINGSEVDNSTVTHASPIGNTANFRIGKSPSGIYPVYGIIDEVGLWNRVLTSAEITQLYNNGNGIQYGGLDITLLSPEDTVSLTTTNISFSANVSDPNSVGIQNVTLKVIYPNGTLFYNETNTSGIEGIYNWTDVSVSDGNWNWSVIAYDDSDESSESDMRTFSVDTAPVITITSPLNQTYSTSSINFNATSSLGVDYWVINYNNTNITITNQTGTSLNKNLSIEEGFYHLLLYANNSESGVWGLNDTIYFTVNLTEPVVTLISPEDNLNSANNTFLFKANTTAGNYTLNNATIYVWFSNGTLMQSETNNSIAGTSDANASFNLTDFVLGSYKWNVQVNYKNSVLGTYYSVFAENNYTLNIEATLDSITYNNHTYETKNENFEAKFNILPNSEISLAQLVYNGTNYTITNLTTTPTLLTLQKAIDIPLNLNASANETKSFFFRFTYGGGFVQETDEFEQNVSFINFQQCDATYDTQALNFTFFNEINQTNINGATNPTTFESSWVYWIGNGNIDKTYSFQNLSSSLNNYQFCIYPYIPSNQTFRINGDIEFSATSFRENSYYLRNATLTNVSSDNLLYLLHTEYATKFFLTFKKGADLISGATITIQKYFTGLGEFKTTGIKTTDDDGETTMWGEVDKTYKFFIMKEGELLGTVERETICAVAPCTLSIIIGEETPEIFESYYETFGQNVVSTLSFNKTSEIITYNFLDTTGLANYFRLKVNRVMLNETKEIICDSQAFSVAGTLTCNLTGKTGEFKATTYISRSPEVIDKVLNVITDEEAIEGLGLIGIFLIMALIITLVFAAAVIGRGSPSVVLWVLAGSIVLLKLAHLFPFTWVVVIVLEVIIFFMISQVKN